VLFVKIAKVKEALEASVIEGSGWLEAEIDHIYASDLMSDVLAFGKPDSILLTGLASQQAIVSAHIAEFRGVVLLRGKKSRDSSQLFARDHHMVLLSTELDMYDACIRLDAEKRGIKLDSGDLSTSHKADDMLLSRDFAIEGSDFAKAGMVSTEIKSLLKKIGIDPRIVRRVAISTYEGEMNVVMHAIRAKVHLSVTPRVLEVMIDDEGKGIPDIDLAMQEGFTTSTEEQRSMGFGSGMGLSNIKRNADDLKVSSVVGKGTTLVTRFLL
jgi:serine/threonine-protein kinase RsbT